MDLPEIPSLLSTQQKRHGLPPCFSISQDTHARRQLEFQNELDQVGVDDFVRTPYMAPQWRAIEPDWVNEVGEIQTWLATVPIVLFMYIRFHHVDRVKRLFGSEQAVPLDLVNLDGFLRASARGDDRWEYNDWWAVTCRRRFLTQDRLLQDPRGFQLPDDVPPAASQERDPIVLPRDAPARGRREQMQRPDIRRKGEGVSSSGRVDTQPGGDDEDEEAEYRRQEDIPEGDGDQDPGETATRHTTLTSTSSPAWISSWLGSWNMAGASDQESPRNP
ncbi:hypothetical protein PIB30_032232 [Stylosanthes scabra]|uniref:Uncharacterized protein n=1 Tax=Stylosanthes scabra TaxID=79078 RepID=A0ABU6UAU7_9FABA|nr:hypothetical protein [Stylosanthes scabra]